MNLTPSDPEWEEAVQLKKELKKAATLLQKFWGKNLNCRVVKSPDSRGLTWEDLQIPVATSQLSENELLQLLAHEWGHRCVAPMSIAQAVWWEILAKKENLPDSQELVHFICDMLVDGWYLDQPRWAGIFSFSLQKRFKHILSSSIGNEDSLTQLVVSCYVVMGRWQESFKTFNLKYDLANQIVKVLFNEDILLDQRVRQVFQMLAAAIRLQDCNGLAQSTARKSASGESTLNESIHPGKSTWKDVQWNIDDLVRLLLSKGQRISAENLEQVLGKAVAKSVGSRLKLLESLTRVMPKVRKLTEKNNSGHLSESVLWHAGEPLRKLEAVRTLEQSGVLIPSVTTLKKKYLESEVNDVEMPAVCLVVDNSSSTAGGILQHELDACVAMIEAAKSYRTMVSLVVFGSQVDIAIKPGTDYYKLQMALTGLEGQSGGTSLAPAIHAAQGFCSYTGEKQATVIFTDSYVFDVDESVNGIKSLMKSGPVVVFCVEDSLDNSFVDELKSLKPAPHILATSPDMPLVDDALQIFN